MSDTVQQAIVAAAILAAVIYLIRSTRKKPGCGGCGPSCKTKEDK